MTKAKHPRQRFPSCRTLKGTQAPKVSAVYPLPHHFVHDFLYLVAILRHGRAQTLSANMDSQVPRRDWWHTLSAKGSTSTEVTARKGIEPQLG